MEKGKKGSFFKSGIWIKEQQGRLTMGSLNKNDTEVKVIPPGLQNVLNDMETDMIEALYGDNAVAFQPEVVELKALLDNLEMQFNEYPLKVSFANDKNNQFKGDYNEIYKILERFVLGSLSKVSGQADPPVIYVNASLIDNHFCIVYRDSQSICHPDMLKKVIHYIRENLNGEISYKAIGSQKSYFDIMIPSK